MLTEDEGTLEWIKYKINNVLDVARLAVTGRAIIYIIHLSALSFPQNERPT